MHDQGQDAALEKITGTAKILQHYGRQIGDEVDDQLGNLVLSSKSEICR